MAQSTDYIPEWFRPSALGALEIFGIDLVKDRYTTLICTDTYDLRAAWSTVNKHFEKAQKTPPKYYSNDTITQDFPVALVHTLCYTAIGPRGRGLFSSLERKKLIKDTNKAIETLDLLLRKMDLDWPIGTFLRLLDDNEETMYRTISEDMRLTPELYRFSISEVLREISDLVESELNPRDLVVKRPNVEDAKKLYFCRITTRFFKVWLGSPLYAVTATFAAVLLHEDVDPEYVRFAARGYQ